MIKYILNNGIIKIKKNNYKITDFSKYNIIEQKEGLTIYKYSKVEAQSNHKFVFQYFYDQYDISDFDNAYVILFCGSMGDNKISAVNSFFNIIKGIELQDNYRFILINEKYDRKEESQIYGIHLYYVKDYNNNPVILIDDQDYVDGCLGFGKLEDLKLNFIFTNVINHINAIFFTLKACSSRIPFFIKYKFDNLSPLFSKDIYKNIFILANFANKETMKEGPCFVEIIKDHADFLKIGLCKTLYLKK